MFKVLFGVFAVLILFMNAPAKADNEDVVIGIMGGVIGGLVLGEIIENNQRPRYVKRKSYIERCVVRYKVYYDTYYDAYIEKPIEQCWIERVQ